MMLRFRASSPHRHPSVTMQKARFTNDRWWLGMVVTMVTMFADCRARERAGARSAHMCGRALVCVCADHRHIVTLVG